MPRRAAREFYIVVTDDDRKQFTISPPSTDDRWETERVVEEQHKGRKIRCCTAPVADGERDRLFREYRGRGYGYTAASLLLSEG